MSREPMTCEEAMRLLAEYLDHELDPERGIDLEQHLDICRSCYSRHEFEKGLKERVAGLAAEPVRPEFHDRIQSLVGRFKDEEES